MRTRRGHRGEPSPQCRGYQGGDGSDDDEGIGGRSHRQQAPGRHPEELGDRQPRRRRRHGGDDPLLRHDLGDRRPDLRCGDSCGDTGGQTQHQHGGEGPCQSGRGGGCGEPRHTGDQDTTAVEPVRYRSRDQGRQAVTDRVGRDHPAGARRGDAEAGGQGGQQRGNQERVRPHQEHDGEGQDGNSFHEGLSAQAGRPVRQDAKL